MAEKKINGRTFRVEAMLATDALILQARIFKMVGPLISQLGTVMKSGSVDGDSDAKKMALGTAALAALSEMFSKSDPLEVARLVKDVVEVAQIRRESGAYDQCDFDGDFTKHAKDIMPVVVFVLQEQFSDFFLGLP